MFVKKRGGGGGGKGGRGADREKKVRPWKKMGMLGIFCFFLFLFKIISDNMCTVFAPDTEKSVQYGEEKKKREKKRGGSDDDTPRMDERPPKKRKKKTYKILSKESLFNQSGQRATSTRLGQ